MSERHQPEASIVQDLSDTEVVGRTVHVDGRSFRNVLFRDCDLVYSGGTFPAMPGCELLNSEWRYAGAALRTLLLLVYCHPPEGLDELWDAIREQLAEHADPDPEDVWAGLRTADENPPGAISMMRARERPADVH